MCECNCCKLYGPGSIAPSYAELEDEKRRKEALKNMFPIPEVTEEPLEIGESLDITLYTIVKRD